MEVLAGVEAEDTGTEKTAADEAALLALLDDDAAPAAGVLVREETPAVAAATAQVSASSLVRIGGMVVLSRRGGLP